jgi:DNA primase
MAVVNEHPDVNVRTLYAGEIAAQTGLAVADLVNAAKRRQATPASGTQQPPPQLLRENAEFAVLTLLVQDWDAIAGWLIEELFREDVHRRAFLALAAAGGDLVAALDAADPDARAVLERAAVADLDVDPEVEARNLIAAAVRRELATPVSGGAPDRIRDDAEARLQLEDLSAQIAGASAAGWLLGWLHRRMEQRAAGGH